MLPPGAVVLTRRAVPAGIAAFDGLVAWSEFDGADSGFRLMVRVHGRTSAARIPPRCVPFDVSIGPDVDGHLVVAYTRCVQEAPFAEVLPAPSGTASGCRIYLLRPATGREHPVAGIGGVGVALANPVVGGGRIAWLQASGTPAERLYTRELAARGPPHALNLIPATACYTDTDITGTHRHCEALGRPGYEQIALRGSMVAAAVIADPIGCGFSTGFISLATTDGGPVRTLDASCQGSAGQDYGGPAFDGGWVYIHRRCRNSGDGCGHFNVDRIPLDGRRGQRADDQLGTNTLAFAFSAGEEYAIAGDPICDAAADPTVDRCPLVEIDHLHFNTAP